MARDATPTIGRRDLVLGATAGTALLALFGIGPALGQAAAPTQTIAPPAPGELEAALKKILGDAKPGEGKLVLDVPEIAENGNTVPFTLSMESPMTDADFVKALHIFAAGNPQPGVASFQLTSASGRAFVSSRMRLAKTQDIVAVAELSDGKFQISRKTVKVTIGGCGG